MVSTLSHVAEFCMSITPVATIMDSRVMRATLKNNLERWYMSFSENAHDIPVMPHTSINIYIFGDRKEHSITADRCVMYATRALRNERKSNVCIHIGTTYMREPENRVTT